MYAPETQDTLLVIVPQTNENDVRELPVVLKIIPVALLPALHALDFTVARLLP